MIMLKWDYMRLCWIEVIDGMMINSEMVNAAYNIEETLNLNDGSGFLFIFELLGEHR